MCVVSVVSVAIRDVRVAAPLKHVIVRNAAGVEVDYPRRTRRGPVEAASRPIARRTRTRLSATYASRPR